MAFNGSGVFVRIMNWVNDKNAAINITASRMDTDSNDFVTGFNLCLTRDGQGIATANLPMAGFKHTGVANGSNRTDYAALGQVQDATLNWVVAGGTADAITVTYSPAITALVDGQEIKFRASAANATTTPNVSPNGLTARTITKRGGAALAASDIPGALAEVILKYNLANTRWELVNVSAPTGTSGHVVPFLDGNNTSSGNNIASGTLAQNGTQTMGAALNEALVATLASATTTDIGAIAGNHVHITGVTTITAFGATGPVGARRHLVFDGALTLTNNANIILPGAANITTAAGDACVAFCESVAGSGIWRVEDYVRGPASAATTLTGTDAIAFLTAAGFAGNKSLVAGGGYYKLPGGFIFQWGTASLAGTASTTVTLPLAWPTAAFGYLATFIVATAPAAGASAIAINTTTFTLANGSSSPQNIFWAAIGT